MKIEEILEQNEGKTLEFKESLESLQNIIRTIVAFANTAGGIIVIGVEDKTKKIIGIPNPLKEEERLANAINDTISPMLMPDIDIYTYRTKTLIVVNVPHITGPYYIKSIGIEKGTYIRLGSTNRIADDETLQALKNFAKNIYFDEMPYIHGNTDDLDFEYVKKLFKSVNKTVNLQTMLALGLIKKHGSKEVPTNGGIILFGKNRLNIFPEAKIRCARFKGINKTIFIDQADIDSYLPSAIEDVIKFIQRNTRLGAKINGLKRKDLPEYPPIALREAIMNAIVHADYAMKGVYISVAIFDDRIEIANPGGLPFGLTLENALSGASRVRNRVIAKVFYHLKWIEQWGRGLGLIIKECENAGLNEPKFEELNNFFRVTLYNEQEAKAKSKPEVWQEKFIKLLNSKNKISTKDAAKFWDITSRAARSRLAKLENLGFVKRIGTAAKDPYGAYVIAKKAKSK